MQEKLQNLLNNSYAPYSNYKVACILIAKDGKEFSGVNVENNSYGATICAERVAICNAMANGYKSNDFKEIHITSSGEVPAIPCMLCRQVFTEFFDEDIKIFIYTKDGIINYSYNDLCPYEF